MVLTRKSSQTIVDRIQREPAFGHALLNEAIGLFFGGEPDAARLILRDLVHATIGFEKLAAQTGIPSKSLHRMLSINGNPNMNNLANIFKAIQEKLGSSNTASVAKTAVKPPIFVFDSRPESMSSTTASEEAKAAPTWYTGFFIPEGTAISSAEFGQWLQ
jgi:DNA-binding phage protein